MGNGVDGVGVGAGRLRQNKIQAQMVDVIGKRSRFVGGVKGHDDVVCAKPVRPKRFIRQAGSYYL